MIYVGLIADGGFHSLSSRGWGFFQQLRFLECVMNYVIDNSDYFDHSVTYELLMWKRAVDVHDYPCTKVEYGPGSKHMHLARWGFYVWPQSLAMWFGTIAGTKSSLRT